MNLVDSSGWLEYFGKGANGAVFAPLIQKPDALIVPTICVYEVFRRVALLRDEEEALKAVGWMSLGKVVELTQELSILAASLSLEKKLPMSDSIILATARSFDAVLWTQDEHFRGMRGVQFVEKR